MKKSQTSLFIVIGFTILILTSLIVLNMNKGKENILQEENEKVFSQVRTRRDLDTYVGSCVEDSVEKYVEDTGIREDTKEQYENLVTSGINDCVNPLLTHLEEQSYSVEQGQLLVNVELNDETIVVDVKYPLFIEKGEQKIEFDEFHYTFDKSTNVHIVGGTTDKEVRLVSPDKRAEIVIPEGVEIRDNNGNLVEDIGLKVEDVHFDGLENKYVVGELVYEGYPDVTFSEPVEIKIEFREEDIPEGYTEENIKIGYWNEEYGIWFAMETEINNNIAVAKTSHLSWITKLIGKPQGIVTTVFEKRFQPSGTSTEEDSGVWLVSGPEGSDVGTVSLQSGFYNDIEIVRAKYPPTLSDLKQYRDHRETMETDIDNYISQPILQYGYFLNPDNPTDDDFIDCEASSMPSDPYNIKYKSIDGYPYFYICDYECKMGVICECDNSACAPSCVGVKQCDLNSNGKMCVPTGKGKNCTAIDPKSECSSYSDKIFGWHNFQCIGGRVRPAQNEDAADFIVFEKNGNAVIELAEFVTGIEVPRALAIPHPARNTFYWENLKNIAEQDVRFGFFCDIEPFENGNLWQTVELSPEAKKELGLTQSNKYFTYGIKGVNVIKKVDHWTAKTNINAKCEIYWYFWGNGFVDANNPHRSLDNTDVISIVNLLEIDIQEWYESLPVWIKNKVTKIIDNP